MSEPISLSQHVRRFCAYQLGYRQWGVFAPSLHQRISALLREAEGRAEAASLGVEGEYVRGPLLFTQAQLVGALGDSVTDQLLLEYGAEVTYAHLVPDSALFRKLGPNERPREAQEAVGVEAAVLRAGSRATPSPGAHGPLRASVSPLDLPLVAETVPGGWRVAHECAPAPSRARVGDVMWGGANVAPPTPPPSTTAPSTLTASCTYALDGSADGAGAAHADGCCAAGAPGAEPPPRDGSSVLARFTQRSRSAPAARADGRRRVHGLRPPAVVRPRVVAAVRTVGGGRGWREWEPQPQRT